MRRFSLLLLTAAFLVLGVGALARPPYLALFTKTYNPQSGSALAAASCRTCHPGTDHTIRNPYGKALEQELDKSGGIELKIEMLRAVEQTDSDGDGWPNIDEIKTGHLPGDPTDHPEGSPPVKPSAIITSTAKPESTAKQAPLIPLHSFHPLLVHFPIALFIVGALLSIVGTVSKRTVWRKAGAINMTIGASVSPLVGLTGLAALLRTGFAFNGIPLIHVCLALSSILFMSATASVTLKLSRNDGIPSGALYWTLLAIATVLVGLTGHVGSLIVYG